MKKKSKPTHTAPLPAYLAKKVPAMLINPKTLKIERKTNTERTVIAAIQRHGPTTAAAQAAGVSPSTISRAFKLPAVQQYLREQLDAAGATDEKILRVINEGLSATTRRDGFSKSGALLKGEERPDYSERREAAKLALRLKGLDTAPDKDEAGGVTNNTIFNIVMQARAARGLPVDVVATPFEPEPDRPPKALGLTPQELDGIAPGETQPPTPRKHEENQ